MAEHLSPAQRRLARVLRDQQAFLIRQAVTGYRFSSTAAERAWGKALRKDTVWALIEAKVLERRRKDRSPVEYHLKVAVAGDHGTDGRIAPEVGPQEGQGKAIAA
ncbi:MAG: hypothetical protein AB7R40_22270 [Nitrospiraceae bacterium]